MTWCSIDTVKVFIGGPRLAAKSRDATWGTRHPQGIVMGPAKVLYRE